MIKSQKTGIGYACNLGASKAIGNVYCVLEADTCLHPICLQDLAASIEKGYVGGTFWLKPKENKFRYKGYHGCRDWVVEAAGVL